MIGARRGGKKARPRRTEAAGTEAGAREEEAVPEDVKVPAFFYRLSPRSQRSYLKSEVIDRYNFVPNGAALARTQALLMTLESGTLAAINQSAQRLIDEVCRVMGVAPVR